MFNTSKQFYIIYLQFGFWSGRGTNVCQVGNKNKNKNKNKKISGKFRDGACGACRGTACFARRTVRRAAHAAVHYGVLRTP